MKSSITLFLSLFLYSGFANWINMNTGINDRLTGVVFVGNNGVLSGHKGLYYTTTGGFGPGSWMRYNIQNNTADSIQYNNTQFYHCYSVGTGSVFDVYACGKDTVANRAVIMKFSFPSISHSFIYVGPSGSALNDLAYNVSRSKYYAVGDNGMVVGFTDTSASILPSGLTDNFSSIAFVNANCWLGTRDKLVKGSITASNSLNLFVTSYPGEDFRDVVFTSPLSSYAAGSGYYLSNTVTDISKSKAYDFGNLNARSICSYSNYVFVGTDHGIFRTVASKNDILEWQPASLNYPINEFWPNLNTSTLYACGDNGVLLYTSNAGGNSKPYVEVTTSRSCVNTNVTISGIVGSGTSCSWYVDGVYNNSSCNSFTYKFTTVGSHAVQLVSANSSYSDTATKIITVVDVPQINLPVTISDSAFCKNETATIAISATQSGISYLFKSVNTSFPFSDTISSNGGLISFSTDTFTASGLYYILAYDPVAGCSSSFTNRISLTVSQPKADFKSGLINAEVGEAIPFYEQCLGATHYSWTFSAGADSLTSTVADPLNSFATPGNTTVKLLCWSDIGCADSMLAQGPYVYSPYAGDTCSNTVNKGVDAPWPGFYRPDIAHIVPSHFGGYFICGHYNDVTISTQKGDSLRLPLRGGYAAKYTNSGVLKWCVYTAIDPVAVHNATDIINSVVEDSKGNVYICGNGNGLLVDATGDTVLRNSSFYSAQDFLLKLDASGKKIWLAQLPFEPVKMAIDHSDNLLVHGTTYYTNLSFFLNGVSSDTLLKGWAGPNNANLGKVFFKLSPQGKVLWSSRMDLDNSNSPEITSFGFDSLNNIYVLGLFSTYVQFYTPQGSSANILTAYPYQAGSGGKLFLAKFDSIGTKKWHTYSNTIGVSPQQTIPEEMVTDKSGNCYITGLNGCTSKGIRQLYHNTNGTVDTLDAGVYFVAKISSDGICRWMNGATYSSWGSGYLAALNGDEISIVGQVYNWAKDSLKLYFTSKNGIRTPLTVGISDYFVAVYDLTGNLRRICINGKNPNSLVLSHFAGLFQTTDGTYYCARNIGFYSGINSYMNWGNNITSLDGRDGSVSRFRTECGNCITMCDTPIYQSETVKLCEGDIYILPSGIFVSKSGQYVTAIPSSTGCDSIVTTTNVELFDASVTQASGVSCAMYNDGFLSVTGRYGTPPYLYSNDGGINYSATNTFSNLPEGDYVVYVKDSIGCEDTALYFVNTNYTPDKLIYNVGPNLISYAFGAYFHWFDCNTMDTIPGANTSVFSPNHNGLYGVMIESMVYGCKDTSSCINMIVEGISNSDTPAPLISLYPNPTIAKTIVDFGATVEQATAKLLGSEGSVIHQWTTKGKRQIELDLSNYPSGFYFVEIRFNNNPPLLYKVGKL